MIKSMTGFASLTRDEERGTIGLTIRAVNHRFLDLQLRLPSALADLEPRLRALLQRRLARGRVEVAVSLQLRQGVAPDVTLNSEFVAALAAAMELAREQGLVSGALTPGDLLRLPQALTIRERLVDTDSLGAVLGTAVEAALDEAIDQLDAMRTREGGHLQSDFEQRKALLERFVGEVAAAAEAGRRALELRLTERARDLAAMAPADPAAVAQEIVRIAQRSDITEEVTRFKAHLAHWDTLTNSPEPCGRKLDFLLQEMNREVNTIGSKADGLLVPECIIQAKAELERLKEQVQNVE